MVDESKTSAPVSASPPSPGGVAENHRLPRDHADLEPHDPSDSVDEDRARRRWTGPAIAVGLAMGAAAIATLVLTGMQDKAIYSKPVNELLAQKAKFVGRPVRAEGNLVHGTLVKRDLPCEYRFSIAKGGSELPVRFAQCVVPDTFRDVPDLDVGVTVEGELHDDNSFEATSVLAKCPSKYDMEQRKQQGERMPHAPLAGPIIEVGEGPTLGSAMRQR